MNPRLQGHLLFLFLKKGGTPRARRVRFPPDSGTFLLRKGLLGAARAARGILSGHFLLLSPPRDGSRSPRAAAMGRTCAHLSLSVNLFLCPPRPLQPSRPRSALCLITSSFPVIFFKSISSCPPLRLLDALKKQKLRVFVRVCVRVPVCLIAGGGVVSGAEGRSLRAYPGHWVPHSWGCNLQMEPLGGAAPESGGNAHFPDKSLKGSELI